MATASKISIDTKTMTNFGHSIKNGHLVANTDILLFEHKCRHPPCTITQIHCPAAGGKHGLLADISFCIDMDDDDDDDDDDDSDNNKGNENKPLTLSLSELANLGGLDMQQRDNSPPADDCPWGNAEFGHTARAGGVYSTIRIPFEKTLKVTLRSAFSGTFWFMIRGLEAFPVVVGDLILPPQARLTLHRFEARHVIPNQLVTLVDVDSKKSGVLLNVLLDANATSYRYLEACMRLLTNKQQRKRGANTSGNDSDIDNDIDIDIDSDSDSGSGSGSDDNSLLFLSSGAEDYFLSAFYFDMGQFKTPNSGVTQYDGNGTLTVYRTHIRDPVLFHQGLKLVFRNGEVTGGCGDLNHCPSQYCPTSTTAKKMKETTKQRPTSKQKTRTVRMKQSILEAEQHTFSSDNVKDTPVDVQKTENHDLTTTTTTNNSNLAAHEDDPIVHYRTLVWTYEWPLIKEQEEQTIYEKEKDFVDSVFQQQEHTQHQQQQQQQQHHHQQQQQQEHHDNVDKEAISFIMNLGQQDLISMETERLLMEFLVVGDARVTSMVQAYAAAAASPTAASDGRQNKAFRERAAQILTGHISGRRLRHG